MESQEALREMKRFLYGSISVIRLMVSVTVLLYQLAKWLRVCYREFKSCEVSYENSQELVSVMKC